MEGLCAYSNKSLDFKNQSFNMYWSIRILLFILALLSTLKHVKYHMHIVKKAIIEYKSLLEH